MTQYVSVVLVWMLCIQVSLAQDFAYFRRHDPSADKNLDPYSNQQINPDSNGLINPAFNWNINPVKNNAANPLINSSINPKSNASLNPQANEVINPAVMKSLNPQRETWKGLFYYNAKNELSGYLTRATQEVLVSFDKSALFDGYYVKAGDGLYNHFTIEGKWTGYYLCYDANGGFNRFNKDGKWTGEHVK